MPQVAPPTRAKDNQSIVGPERPLGRGLTATDIMARRSTEPAAKTAIRIDDGIEMPPPIRRGRATKYPLAGMEIGQSFFVPGKPSINLTLRGKQLGARFQKRRVTENGEIGIRVWRTA